MPVARQRERVRRLVVRLRPTDGRPAALMFTWAGQLGYHGLNEHGVAHFANGLTGGPLGIPAIPHYPLKRGCLEQRSVADCLDLLSGQPVCSSGNMVLADGEGSIADIEIAPDATAVLRAEDHAVEGCGTGALLHTNHFLDGPLAERFPPLVQDSMPRLDRLHSLVREQWGAVSVESVKGVLADHGGDCEAGGCICRHGLHAMEPRLSAT